MDVLVVITTCILCWLHAWMQHVVSWRSPKMVGAYTLQVSRASSRGGSRRLWIWHSGSGTWPSGFQQVLQVCACSFACIQSGLFWLCWFRMNFCLSLDLNKCSFCIPVHGIQPESIKAWMIVKCSCTLSIASIVLLGVSASVMLINSVWHASEQWAALKSYMHDGPCWQHWVWWSQNYLTTLAVLSFLSQYGGVLAMQNSRYSHVCPTGSSTSRPQFFLFCKWSKTVTSRCCCTYWILHLLWQLWKGPTYW